MKTDFIKTYLMNYNKNLIVLAGTVIAAFPVFSKEKSNKEIIRPNIIYILADDLGYGDLSIFGQKKIATPNIDRLAKEGLTFSRHYSGAPVCAPSRCVLMTGMHTGHSVIRGNKSFPGVGVTPLINDIITLPEAIKRNTNYITGMCGRWHLGGELTKQTPYDRGFDYHFGKLSSDFPNKHGVMIDSLWDTEGKHIQYKDYSARNIEPMYENGKLYNLTKEEMTMRPINMDRLVTNKALSFIDKNKVNNFFLYVAYSLVHSPMEYHKDTPIEENTWPEKERAFASMLRSLDKYVGEITAQVDKQGLGQKTIIIFTSDNGAHNEGGHSYEFFNSNGDFRGFKRELYDGGTHTPMLLRWKGTVAPGSTTDLLSAFWDVMPTICDLAGAPIPDQTDGISFAPTILGKKQVKHDYLYWEFNEHAIENISGPEYKQAVVFDNWKVVKYIDANIIEVFDLSKDQGEEWNLVDSQPKIVKKALGIMAKEHKPNLNFPMLKSERNSVKHE